MSHKLVLTNHGRKLLWIRLNNGDYVSIPAGATNKSIEKSRLASEASVEKLCKMGMLRDDTKAEDSSAAAAAKRKTNKKPKKKSPRKKSRAPRAKVAKTRAKASADERSVGTDRPAAAGRAESEPGQEG